MQVIKFDRVVVARRVQHHAVRRRAAQSGLARRHTYVPTKEGWLYLAVVLDLFTRKIVGWAMRGHMPAELTIAALTMAIQRQKAAAPA